MKKTILISLFIFCGASTAVYSQSDSSKFLFDSSGIFIGKPDSLPSFKGGKKAWINFLTKNLNSSVVVDNGAPAGIYTTIVSFLVDENGNLSDFKAEHDAGYGSLQEAIRILKLSPGYNPADYKGQPVKYRHKESFTFQVTLN
jgi:hypothetical protein